MMSDHESGHSKPVCKYGTKCYQKNPEHHRKYKHPNLTHQPEMKNKHRNRFSPYTKVTKPDAKNDKKFEAINKGLTNDDPSNTDQNKYNDDKPYDIELNDFDNDDSFDVVVKLPKDPQYYDKNNDPNIFKELFLVEMPSDFFLFFQCLIEEGDDIEKMLANVNLQLIGPYDVLLGKLPKLEEKELYLIHWRFFYDLPEYQAVLKMKGNSQYHIGYFRDDPNDKPVFMASNDSSKTCHLSPMADNIFGSVYLYLLNEKKRSPFTSVACQRFMEKVKKWAEKHNFSITEFNMKKRFANTVTKTFHGAGIVVPYNRKTELGYRKLTETDANLKKMFDKLSSMHSQTEKDQILSELQPLITYANIAVDECDFGTGLECGIDLFCSGVKELESCALSSLSAAYSLLNREAFSKIIKVHLKNRRKGPDMSLMNLHEN